MKKNNSSSLARSSNIIPLGDRVLVEELSPKDTNRKTDAGIFIPDTVSENREVKKGKVIAVGSGRYDAGTLIPVGVKKGDVVIFSWGDKVVIDDKEYMIVKESEITAVIK